MSKTIKGVYVLVISATRDFRASVGALGKVHFRKGVYTYIGSAQNNLEKRIKRHLRKAKRKFWHIDYLLANNSAKVVRVFYVQTGKTEECKIARKLGKNGIPVVNFGCSDCRCASHLFMLKGSYDSSNSLVFDSEFYTLSPSIIMKA
ncbi:MAG: GIY-YIG nuclease family protein [Candidatus Bathyarchaeota archaeon]|nr:GIY-YIG nuclease family protein [Candidatus Bathyarchaeota archaeon]MDH5788386.1 GIY-YIG nuclease family protein [Candidatus Bathyarchaeota archaeon]